MIGFNDLKFDKKTIIVKLHPADSNNNGAKERIQNELLHSQYKHNKATKFINSQVKKIEDIKIDIMFLSAYVFRLFRQYKDLNNYCLKETNYKRTEEYRKLDEEYNKLHDIIIKCMKDIDL